jgi:hypothetical protein
VVPGLYLEGLGIFQKGQVVPTQKGSSKVPAQLRFHLSCAKIAKRATARRSESGLLARGSPFSYSRSPPPRPPSLILCFNAAAAHIALLFSSNYPTRSPDSCYSLKALPPDVLHPPVIKRNGDLGTACLQGGNQNSLFHRETQKDARDLLSTKGARTRRVDIGAWCPVEFPSLGSWFSTVRTWSIDILGLVRRVTMYSKKIRQPPSSMHHDNEPQMRSSPLKP